MTNKMKVDDAFLYATLAEASYVVFEGKDYQNNGVAIGVMASQNRIPESLGKSLFDSATGGSWSVVHTLEKDNNFPIYAERRAHP